MDGISRSRGWDKEIPHGVLPMEQLVLSDKWERNIFLSHPNSLNRYYNPTCVILHLLSHVDCSLL